MSLVLFNPYIGPYQVLLGQSEPVSDGNEEVFHIPKGSIITGTAPSDCLASYLGHILGRGSYPSAEVLLQPQSTGQLISFSFNLFTWFIQ